MTSAPRSTDDRLAATSEEETSRQTARPDMHEVGLALHAIAHNAKSGRRHT